jgi:hypothetical protein
VESSGDERMRERERERERERVEGGKRSYSVLKFIFDFELIGEPWTNA